MFGKTGVLVAALTLASLSPALAQDAQGSAPAPMGHHWQMDPARMAEWHKQRCEDHFARAAGRLAFLEAKLNVTDAQRSAYNRWRDVVMHEAGARKDACLAHQFTPGEHHTVLERTAMMQKRLEDRLAAVRAQEPALEALYNSLSPDQKAVLDHMHHGRGHGWGGRGGHHGFGMMNKDGGQGPG